MAKTTFKPGQIVPRSGQYGVVDSRGKPLGREVTSTQNEHFPPTEKPNQGYVLNDLTKHPVTKNK
jgi:hypothetical protein